MARIISLINQKGGTGKTTSAVNLGAYLAALGKYVLLIDLDPQANATSAFGIKMEECSEHKGSYHLFFQDIDPENLIKKTGLFGYNIIPSTSDLTGAVVELTNLENREFRLYEALRKIRMNYDYILVDSPPSLSLITLNGIVAADEIIIPVQCEYYALEGLGQLMKTIEMIKENLNRDIKIKGVLLTMHNRQLELSRDVENEVRKNFPGYVFDTIIPRNVDLAEAPSFSKTILEYNPESKGGTAYRQLAQEIIKLDNDNINEQSDFVV